MNSDRLREILIAGALTLTVWAVGFKLIELVIENIQHMWEWLWQLDGLDRWFTGDLWVLGLLGSVLLTAVAIAVAGALITAEHPLIVRLIRITRHDVLPWASRFDDAGRVRRVSIKELLMWQPALADIAGKVTPVFITGDTDQDAELRDDAGALIGQADWVAIFEPSMPAIVPGHVYPIPKHRLLRVENSAPEVLTWLQTKGKSPIRWQPRLWPATHVDEDFRRRLEKDWGFTLTPDAHRAIG